MASTSTTQGSGGGWQPRLDARAVGNRAGGTDEWIDTDVVYFDPHCGHKVSLAQRRTDFAINFISIVVSVFVLLSRLI
jgi:hypothetical protein